MSSSDKPRWSHKEIKARIKRLVKAEKELDRMNPPRDVFSTDIESIKSKLKSVPQVEEVEAELATLKQKIARYEASLKEAANAEERAKQALASAAKEIEGARSYGLDVSEAEGLLAQGREVLGRKDFQLATQSANKAAESASSARATAKPQVVVELDVENYTPGEWKAVALVVSNQGKAHAQNVGLDFSPEVEVKWLAPVARLDAGAREVLNIGLRPVQAGDIPLDVTITYKDMAEKDYSGVQRFWLKVGRAVEVGRTVAEADLGAGLLPQLENYTLERKIGSGGFADVYLGRSSEGLNVAVKIPRMSQYETIEAKDFMGEAELWSRLSKQKLPYIVELYECGAVPCPWIAMEYMDSGSLRDRMTGMECKDCLNIATKLMQALHSAHHHGVIHRDIKPENVLFDNQNTPKLTDWGLGKVLLDASVSSVGFRGTVVYSAPEQLAGSRFGTVDWRTDIYQMGMLVYEMLTGQLPFTGLEPGTIIPRILTEEPPPPSQVNTGIPAGLDAPVLRALAKGKEDRFQSMDAFKDRLEEALKGL